MEGQKIKLEGPYVLIDRDAYSNIRPEYQQPVSNDNEFGSSSEDAFSQESPGPETEDYGFGSDSSDESSETSFDSDSYSGNESSDYLSNDDYSQDSSDSFGAESQSSSQNPYNENVSGYGSQEAYSGEQVSQNTMPEPPTQSSGNINEIYSRVLELEKQVNYIVLKNAEKRQMNQLSEEDELKARTLSEAEWIIRDLKKKLNGLL
jgi:hypothetical protein